MKITEISRTVSMRDYSNVSAKAIVEDGENLIEAMVKLDKELNLSLDKIYKTRDEDEEKERNKRGMFAKIEALKIAIEKNQLDELPF